MEATEHQSTTAIESGRPPKMPKAKTNCRNCGGPINEHRVETCRGYCRECWQNRCAACGKFLSETRIRSSSPQRYFCDACWQLKKLEMGALVGVIQRCTDKLVDDVRDLADRGYDTFRIATKLDRAPHGLSVTPPLVVALANRNGIELN